MSGHDIENNSSTGPVYVKVIQDGIGRTGGIVLGIFAGLAFGLAVMTLILMVARDADRRAEKIQEDAQVAIVKNRVMHLQAEFDAFKQEK